jgi:hypothetical protein
VIAGLTGITAMIGADASAQDCPGWLKWACPDSASSNRAVSHNVRREKQLSPTTATSNSTIGRRTKQAGPVTADTATAERTQSPGPAREAKVARHTQSGASSSDHRKPRHGEGQGKRLGPAMNDQEKEALFQQFLEWQKARRLNAETNL